MNEGNHNQSQCANAPGMKRVLRAALVPGGALDPEKVSA